MCLARHVALTNTLFLYSRCFSVSSSGICDLSTAWPMLALSLACLTAYPCTSVSLQVAHLKDLMDEVYTATKGGKYTSTVRAKMMDYAMATADAAGQDVSAAKARMERILYDDSCISSRKKTLFPEGKFRIYVVH